MNMFKMQTFSEIHFGNCSYWSVIKLQARKELLRRKKVVKLQAAVRGHLVRNQAMGSLRCVQAIVKMQTLVRARHSTKDGSHASAISVRF